MCIFKFVPPTDALKKIPLVGSETGVPAHVGLPAGLQAGSWTQGEIYLFTIYQLQDHLCLIWIVFFVVVIYLGHKSRSQGSVTFLNSRMN